MPILESWQLWVIGGIILIILEMFTFTFFLASFGAAAIFTALSAWKGGTVSAQLATFAIANVILLAIIRPLVVKGLYHRSDRRPTNVNALVGQTGTVVDAIPDDRRPGRVKLGGEEWRALSADGQALDQDTVVEVIQIDSATLLVRPLIC
jgi:membrane protein implicated in regulation of membrane protease activity